MKAARSKAHVLRYVTEDEFFWQNQLSKFRSSGLTKRKYCRQSGMNYDRFTYWTRKLIAQQAQKILKQESCLEKPKQLLPLQIKPECKTFEAAVLFSLNLKNGCILHVHNEQALSIILERMA